MVGRGERWRVAAVVVLALAARLSALPFATTDGGDAPSRVWAGWEWLSHPRLLTHGVWGPLHSYLIALSLWVVPDPVHAPAALSVLFSVASAALLYWFVRLEFGEPREALLVGLTYAVYPIAIRNGVSVRSETPFVFFLLLTGIGLARARGGAGDWRHAAASGIALTLASMLRYEAWMLIPLLGLLVWRRPRLLLIFAACALVHPIFWTVGNWLHNGDPFYGFTFAARWELETMGRGRLGWASLLARAAAYPWSVLEGMSLPIGLVCLAGAALALGARHRTAVWLVPLAGLLGLWGFGVARGALVPKLNYTEIAGTLLFPFSALLYQRLGVQRWPLPRIGLAAITLPLVSLLFVCRPCLERVGLGRLAGPTPIPRIENQPIALGLAATLRDALRGEDMALISDHYGWGSTHYVALLTGLPRSRIFLAPGAPNQRLDPDSLADFLRRHARGVLIARSGSRFFQLLGLGPGATSAAVGGTALQLGQARSIVWPGRPPAMLMVFHYTATPFSSAAPPGASGLGGFPGSVCRSFSAKDSGSGLEPSRRVYTRVNSAPSSTICEA
jgi:hypothetical protein